MRVFLFLGSFDEAMKSRDRVPLPEKEFEVKLEDAEKDALKVVVKFL